jgi:hypothetical protein
MNAWIVGSDDSDLVSQMFFTNWILRRPTIMLIWSSCYTYFFLISSSCYTYLGGTYPKKNIILIEEVWFWGEIE